MTLSALERVLTLSIRILKTSSNQRITLEQKGKRLQKLNVKQSDALESIRNLGSAPADGARVALIQYLGKLSEKKIREQL